MRQKLDSENRPYFKGIISLYKKETLLGKIFSSKTARVYFPTLHEYLKKERANDVKFTQAVLGGLPKDRMQNYFHERNADVNF